MRRPANAQESARRIREALKREESSVARESMHNT